MASAMASASSRTESRGAARARWADDITESSGSEYMLDFKPNYKAEKSGHKGGLAERVESALKERKQAKGQAWAANADTDVDPFLKVAVPKEIVCNEHGNSSTIKQQHSLFHVSISRT